MWTYAKNGKKHVKRTERKDMCERKEDDLYHTLTG